MKKNFTLLLMLALAFFRAGAQEISLQKGWKLSIGDSPEWSSPGFNDSGWQNADLSKPWEQQGHANTDGYGWYRLHVIIPSSIKEKAFLKDSLTFVLGSIDDNDQVFLNGKLIGQFGGLGGVINESHYGPRSYTIATNNPAILWDKENVLAIRVYDTGGDGGVYGNPFNLHMTDVMEHVEFDKNNDFSFGDHNSMGKSVVLTTKNKYNYQGTVSLKVIDPETNATVLTKKTDTAHFTVGKPFKWWFTFAAAQKKSYKILYTFTDKKTGKSIYDRETTPYVLTPEVSKVPKINGAAIFGARPGHPVLYLIPATGRKPLKYKVQGLPEGLKLDAATGIITGTVQKKGSYPLVFTVANGNGSAVKKFTLVIGDNIGLTPALGWNSWNAWGLSVNDEKVRTSAREMAEKLSSHGWAYINIDDGWEAEERAPNGKIVTNQKFPDMKGLTDYVHGLGLRMGIYSSPGTRTCGGYLGSWQHEDDDAQSYADWGIDYLKYDWCSYGQIAPRNPDLDELKKPYQVMRASLDKTNRDIMYSFCQYGMGDVWKWGAETGGNSWRTTGDITDTWRSMSEIGFRQDPAAPFAGPGHFNDPDMLVVGKVGWGPALHNSRLTFDEQYTHISLWSLLASPLLIGCDMGNLDRFTLSLLTNDEVLAIDQDELAKSARQYSNKNNTQIWVKDMKDGSKAIGLFNTSNVYKTVSLSTTDPAIKGYTKFRDVWRQQNIPAVSGKVAPHGVLLVRVSK